MDFIIILGRVVNIASLIWLIVSDIILFLDHDGGKRS